jgi:hypothetical protein
VTLAADAPLAESPRQYFRRHLQQRTTTSSDLVWYLEESTPRFGGSAEVRLAVEELVDRLGAFMGFRVTREDQDGHALWTSPLGPRLVVWVESGVRAAATLASGLHRRAQLLAMLDVARDDDLSCLYVLVGAHDERLLDEAVAVRRAARHVRLISTSHLVMLAGAIEHHRLAHRDALALLRPPSALADGVVHLIADNGAARP